MPDTTSDAESSPFPSYGDWLTSHDDATLVDLLWRLRAFHTPPPSPTGGRRSGSVVTDAVSRVADVAALRQLNAAALAVLHALVHAGAAHRPVDAPELVSSLGELCDLAGTPRDRRPAPESVPDILPELAHRGLAFGPHLRIDGSRADTGPALFPVAVPAHLQNLFAGTTDVPWALVDGYRCPVPTADLPTILAELPDRQRRLLDTLASAGGIGHSTSLDDPDRPLARMIAAGLLDRVDAETARLSPRVGAAVADRVVPDPGGDFTPPEPVAVSDRSDGAGVARAVETLRRATDMLTTLGTAPLRPLNGGGVGVREITRVARHLGMSAEEVSETLLLCRHAGFIATGLPLPTPEVDTSGADGEVWGVTDRGAEFLRAGTARRWSLLLAGWASSPHSPWNADASGAHLLQESLDDPRTADLRGLLAQLVCVLDASADPAVQLWRLRPSLAARTSTAALAGVLSEAEALGLCSGGTPTSAAAALATTSSTDAGSGALTDALEKVLPAPVRTLIIQADLTVLAPGLLAPETEAVLRRIADVESTGMASVWRISPESLRRAADAGETAERVRGFLTDLAPEIPQSLDYLITDTFRSTGALTAGTASTVITAEDAAALDAAWASLTEADIRDTGLRRVAPTVLVGRAQLSQIVDLLEETGVRVSVDGDAAATTHGPALSLVPDPVRPTARREDVEDQLAAAVEGLRRTRQAAVPDATGRGAAGQHSEDLPDVTTVRDPREIMTALRSAYDRGTRVEISYVNADGAAVQEWISVVTMSPVSIIGVTEADGASLRIQPHRIAWVATPV